MYACMHVCIYLCMHACMHLSIYLLSSGRIVNVIQRSPCHLGLTWIGDCILHYGYLLEATLVITGLRASPSACWSRSCRIYGYMCLKRRVKPLTFISLTIAWNNPPSAPHSFSTDSTFILSIFSEYRSEKKSLCEITSTIPRRHASWELKAEECLWVRARFQQKSLCLQLSVCCPEDWGRWWGETRERWLTLSLSSRLRFYSPLLVEVRLVDAPAIVTVIFGQRCGIELNGCEKKRSVCGAVGRCAPRAAETGEWVKWAAAAQRERASNSIHANRIGQNTFSCHMEARGRRDGTLTDASYSVCRPTVWIWKSERQTFPKKILFI